MRKHGFQRPHNWPQRLAAGGSLLTTGLFCTGTLSLLPAPVLYFASAVYALVTLLTVGMWVHLTACNPTDMTVNGRKWCGHCSLFVNPRSWHCRQCQRCVINLDHHCKWLNNCVGEVNYRPFVGLCVVFLGQACLEVTLCSLVVDRLLTEDSVTADLAQARVSSVELAAVFTAVALVAATVRALLMIHLMAFHAYLRCQGLTTYTFILQKLRKEQAAVVPVAEIDPKVNVTNPDDQSELYKMSEAPA